MTSLTIQRVFPAPIERVFAFVTRREHLLRWWGPEGMSLPEDALDLTAPGPWFSVMQSAEGNTYRVSGEVTEVAPPARVAFTWAWHDPTGARGHESRVTIALEPAGSGHTRMTLQHEDLADEESRTGHEGGWMSSLRKLEALFDRTENQGE